MTAPTSPEFDLAAACCIWPPSPRRDRRLEAALAAPINWGRFVDMVARHRIQGLAHAALSGNGAVPDETRRSLAALGQTLAYDALRLTREALRLDQAFADAGIPVAFIKGPVLAQLIHGTVGLRQCKDLDLLVPIEALPAARQLLAGRGYRRIVPPEVLLPHLEARWIRDNKDFEYLHPQSRIQIELHWRLFENRCLMPEVPPPERWVTVAIMAGARLRTLAPTDLLLYLCLHGAVTAWFRMKWLADVDSFIAKDPAALQPLVTIAAQRNLLRPVAQGLLLCQRLFGTELPADIERILPKGRAVKYLVATGLRAMNTGEGTNELARVPFASTRINLARFLLKSDWRYRGTEASFVLNSLEDWITVPLPPGFAFLYPFLRLPLWIARKIRKVVAAGRIKKNRLVP